MMSVILNTDSKKAENLRPEAPVPAIKTDLKALDSKQDLIVWLGHSSWFIQIGGVRVLIDPVFSSFAAPFSFLNKAYKGTTIYSAEDMPEIDALLISHDHWDHLDYQTLMQLRPKVRKVICPLGIGADLTYWGFAATDFYEGDWYDHTTVGNDLVIHILPARHYSGRLFSKNKTLWAGFALESSRHRLFFSGDSGYGPHFSDIREKFSSFDMVLLDAGQYDHRWPYIHMTPEEAAQVAKELRASTLIPAHVGRFTIANHPWNEPFNRLAAVQNTPYSLVTPLIGEPVLLDHPATKFPDWWKEQQKIDDRPSTQAADRAS